MFCFGFDYFYHYFDCCFFSLYGVYVMHTICMGGWVGCSVRCCFHIAMRGITSYNNYNNLIIICIIIHYNNLIIIRFSNYFFQLCPRHIPHISILCVCICTWKSNKQTKEKKEEQHTYTDTPTNTHTQTHTHKHTDTDTGTGTRTNTHKDRHAHTHT